MPVAIQNKEKGPSVFSDPVSNVAIEWAGAGDESGGDIQWVPDSLMSDINFMRAISRGIFEQVQVDTNVQAKLDTQGESYRERRDASEALTEQVMDRQSERPIIIGQVDEKGQVTQSQENPRSPDEIQVNVNTEPDVYGPEDAPPVERPTTGSVVQMDEEGQPLQSEPELKVTMTDAREKDEMGDPTDQVATVDTTGLGGKIPNVEEALVAPALLEAAAEAGEEGLSDEEREELPTSLAEQKEQEKEEAEGNGGASEESAEVAVEEAEEEVAAAEEEAAEEEAVEEEEAEVAGSGYDPADHSVAEVVSYIQNHPEEQDAIIASEKQGKDRKGITSLEEEG